MSSAMQDTPSADAGGAASAGEPGQNQVLGERATTLVDRAVSAQSRLSNVLAISLMSVLGLGSLTWYYANSMTRQSRARHNVQSASATRAAGDTSLPSLGRIDPPLPPSPPSELPVDPADRVQLAASLPEIPLTGTAPSYAAASPPPTPEQLAQQRQLSGAVFSSASTSGASVPPSAPSQGAAWTGAGPSTASGSAPGDISALLRPSTATAVRAEVLPAQRLLLPKGAFIDCTLETAIDSTLPGMTTCVMATDAFGVDGSVVLLERGTKLVGETKGQVQQGQARVFVLWTEARTPAGVIVPLASPGADELGRAGLPGEVNRHFWERFGAAMLISIIDGAVETTASRSGGGTVIVDPSASQGVMTEVLKGTANIPPTVVKLNGDRIQVLVARDLDFRSVYELRATAGR
jgi:type IV secretion system protein VirB10